MKQLCPILNEVDHLAVTLNGEQMEGKIQKQIWFFCISLLICFLVYSFYLFILEMNEGKNASLNLKDTLSQENQGLTFESTDILFSVQIVDTYGNYISNKQNEIFSVIFYYCEQIDLKKILESFKCSKIYVIQNLTIWQIILKKSNLILQQTLNQLKMKKLEDSIKMKVYLYQRP